MKVVEDSKIFWLLWKKMCHFWLLSLDIEVIDQTSFGRGEEDCFTNKPIKVLERKGERKRESYLNGKNGKKLPQNGEKS